MAGSWIKLRHDLADAPEVRRMARTCGVTKDDVLGKLYRLWSWFDRHSHAGRVAGDGLELVDEIVGLQGFAAALVSAGWLVEDHGGIAIPHWERHNSETAKQRALAAERQEKHREKQQCNGEVTPDALPDKTRLDIPPPPREASPGGWEEFRRAWNHQPAAGRRKAWKPATPPHGREAVFHDASWLEAAAEAMGRLPACRYFDSPVTLIQFAGDGFVQRVLGGQYDSPKTATARPAGPGRADDRPPAKPFVGTDDERFRATMAREEMARKLREGVA